VREEAAELELLARDDEAVKEALAAADAKDDSAVGATGSGTTVDRKVFQGRFEEVEETLLLRSRSPSPSRVETGDQDSRREEAGSGASGMRRWPTRRRGGKETAVSGVERAWSSSSLSASRGRA
jgi:hypothetical protein